MSYRNSSAYIQQMINCILWSHCDFFRVYVDDIVIYIKFCSLSDHIEHLDLIFKSLTEKSICLSLKKSFLDYLTVQLLNQCVDTLELITAEDKLAVIVNIEFSHTLFTLEKYLGMTGYLRQYISYYTIIIKLLQKWKMRLNHDLQKLWAEQKSADRKNIEGNMHKAMTDRTSIEELTLSELNSFYQLQSLFFRLTILIHYTLKCQLYINMNTSKEFSFRADIYHMKESHSFITVTDQKSMKLILFLSKALVNAETHYWLTELKVTDLIWLIQKIHHMLESAEKLTIIYTDHFITLSIVHQSSLTSITSIDKINLQLVYVSEYLQRFCLNVWHKKGKTNIV